MISETKYSNDACFNTTIYNWDAMRIKRQIQLLLRHKQDSHTALNLKVLNRINALLYIIYKLKWFLCSGIHAWLKKRYREVRRVAA